MDCPELMEEEKQQLGDGMVEMNTTGNKLGICIVDWKTAVMIRMTQAYTQVTLMTEC
jgi:hypothetical protein